jgi:hypothetical protein
LEVGSFGGKSLEAALKGNEEVIAAACDPEYSDSLRQVVERYSVKFFHQPFEVVDLATINQSIGVMYLDNDHSYENTLNHLIKVIPYLADKAMVFVDDHCYCRSYNAVRDFVRDHATNVTIVHELWPECDIAKAMTNHCLEDWYNGFVCLEWEREPERLPHEFDEAVLGGFHCRGEGPYPKGYEEIVKEITGSF